MSEQPDNTTCLLDLPQQVLLLILQKLDNVSDLCTAARASPALRRLAAHRCLWPAESAHNDWALEGVKRLLGDMLSLPPQVFQAQLEVGRSRRFPVLIPMHNLRSILGTSDAEGLAERTSRALQEQVEHAANSLWRYDSWQQLPPAASISICRADGASIRAAPRPQAVVPRLVHQLQRAGWPPQLPTVAPAATEAGNQHSPTSQHGGAGAAAALPSGLLHAVQQCQHRQGLVHEQQVSQLRHLSGYKPAPQAARPWRANLTALQAAAGKLPDEDTARAFAGQVISSH